MIIQIDWDPNDGSSVEFVKVMLKMYDPDGPKMSDPLLKAIIETVIARLHLKATLTEDGDEFFKPAIPK